MSLLHRSVTRPAVAALVALALLAVGCSSSGRAKESEKAVEGFQATRGSIAKAQAEVDRANASLDQLTAGGDLQKSYIAFNGSVADLEKSAADARKRAESMRARVKEYTDKWQQEMETMEDPTIRANLAQRREAVRANFQKVQGAAKGARDAYEPYMAQLKEIQRALSIDLTPQNVTGIKPAIDKTKGQGATLKQKLVALQSELDTIAGGMSPTGAAPKK